MDAVILSIGDELVLGQTVDTNAAWLSARLAERGVMTLYHKTVADDLTATVQAIKEGSRAARLMILTGGLGPTEDDLTRQALAAALDRPLQLHRPSLRRIRSFFKSLGRAMPAANEIQAMCPRGSLMLANNWGTAPGVKARIGWTTLYAFPGVPREMTRMYGRYVEPTLTGQAERAILTATLRTFGAGESTVAALLGDLMRRDRRPVVGTTVTGGVVSVRIRSDESSAETARRKLRTTVRAARRRLGTLVFGREDDTLAGIVGRCAKHTGTRIAVAESCTGGLVAKMITDVPGASEWFAGGWVVYSNVLKQRELGVPVSLLRHHGAVSEAVACAMARGALRKSGADMAVAITGIAGPGGGSRDKPVGTVWMALAGRGASRRVARVERTRFPGDRDMVRDRAAKTALNMMRLEFDRWPAAARTERKGRL
jgi:nicotinamide-nucleotide amidase